MGQPRRGEAKPNQNRIKEQQLGLFSDRTSAHGWWANQLRVLLSAAAYVLMETLRRVALEGSELARVQVGTVIVRNMRRIRRLLSSAYPYQGLFACGPRAAAFKAPKALPRCRKSGWGLGKPCPGATLAPS